MPRNPKLDSVFLRSYGRIWRENNPDKVKDKYLRYSYGISIYDFEKLYQKYNGNCHNPACINEATDVDHEHSSGIIRGLLCRRCNRTLGLLSDDPELIEGLLYFLEEFWRRKNNGRSI